MKIEKISFKNINSLRGEHEIDFTKNPFNSQALFAITGNTGSGKTTILDVITLALYNYVPRLGKISKNEIDQNGVILTRGENEAYARVTYLTNKGRYISEWQIGSTKSNNLKEYEMSLLDSATGEYLTEKKTEVITKNEALIGLNYDQFSKSVLLAQGEFSKFLKAKKNERSALLERIIGTEIYRKLGAKAYEKAKEITTQINDLEKLKQDRQTEIIDEERLISITKIKIENEEKLEQTEETIRAVEKQIELKLAIESLENQIAKVNKKLEENNTNFEQFEQTDGQSLLNHQLVEPFADKLQDVKRLTREIVELDKKKEEINLRLSKVNESKNSIKKSITNLLGKEVQEAKFLEALNEFEQKVESLEANLKKLTSDYSNYKEQANIYLKPYALKIEKSQEQESIQLAFIAIEEKATKDVSSNGKLFSQKEIDNIVDTKQTIEHQIEKIQEANKKAITINNLEVSVEELHRQISLLKKELEPIPTDIKESEKELKIAEGESYRIENVLLKASLADHRKNLIDGEACPLCGALHHPYASLLVEEETNLKNQLETQKELVQKLVRKTSSLKEQEKQKQAQIKEKDAQLTVLKKQMTTDQEAFKKAFNLSIKTDWKIEIEKLRTKRAQLTKLEEALNTLKIAKTLIPIFQNLEELKKEALVVNRQKKELFSNDKPIQLVVTDLQKKWTAIDKESSTISDRLQTFLSKIEDEQKKLDLLKNQLSLDFAKTTITSLSWATNALLPLERVQLLRQKKEQYQSEKQEYKGEENALKEQFTKLKKNDVKEDKANLIAQIEALNTNKIKLKSEINQLSLQLSKQEETNKKIASIEKELDKLLVDNKYWFMLNKLIGDSTGNKFNTFAQQLTLKQLLVLANKRLQFLNKRYLIDSPQEGEDDSLSVIDIDMGGLRRTVGTLSGGETFMISLALALGLSDLAAKNVQINSLFIDEGFGSLDTETLDQTLDTLERLQQEGDKLIGIISHVQSLKERINTQVVVNQNGRGYSQLEIVG